MGVKTSPVPPQRHSRNDDHNFNDEIILLSNLNLFDFTPCPDRASGIFFHLTLNTSIRKYGAGKRKGNTGVPMQEGKVKGPSARALRT